MYLDGLLLLGPIGLGLDLALTLELLDSIPMLPSHLGSHAPQVGEAATRPQARDTEGLGDNHALLLVERRRAAVEHLSTSTQATTTQPNTPPPHTNPHTSTHSHPTPSLSILVINSPACQCALVCLVTKVVSRARSILMLGPLAANTSLSHPHPPHPSRTTLPNSGRLVEETRKL